MRSNHMTVVVDVAAGIRSQDVMAIDDRLSLGVAKHRAVMAVLL